MNLDFTDDQEALRATLRDFFEKESPIATVRAAEPLGFDAALWGKLRDLGLGSIAVPEDRGGSGAGFVELAIAAELLGRWLAPAPLIEAAVANSLLTSVPASADAEPLVSRAVAGELLATLALRPAAAGVARLVPAGAVADLVVVTRGDELLLVRPSVPPDAAIPNLGALPLADCPIPADALVLASGPTAGAAHCRAVDRWRLLTGAALMGLAARALEIGIDYVMQRRAFGALVASFQTVQHRLADNATALEGARLLAYSAAWAQDVGIPTAGVTAAMSFLFASELACKTTSESLHFHGGYGYTLEYDIQLYFRRAKAWSMLAGDRRTGYVDLAHRLFDTEGT